MTPAYSPASHYQSAPEAVYRQRSDRVFRTGGCETARSRQHARQRALVQPYQPYQRSRAHGCSLWMLTTAIGAHKAGLAQQLRQLPMQLPVSGLCRPRSRNHHYVGLAHCLPQQLRSCRSQAPLDLIPDYCLANPFPYHKSHTNCARLPRPTHHCTQIPGPEPASLCKYPPEISLEVNPGDFAQLAPTVSAASPQNDRISIAHRRPLSKRLCPCCTIENRDGITHLPLAYSRLPLPRASFACAQALLAPSFGGQASSPVNAVNQCRWRVPFEGRLPLHFLQHHHDFRCCLIRLPSDHPQAAP